MPETPRFANFTCRICNNTADCPEFTAREMMYGSRETFAYVQCQACGCLQIAEIPVDLARHYPANYYSQMPRVEPAESTGAKGALVRWYCRSAALHQNSSLYLWLRSRLPVPADFAEFGNYLTSAKLLGSSEKILDVGCGSSPHRLAAFKRCGFAAVEGIDPFIAGDTTYHGIAVRRRTIDAVQGSYGLIMFHHSLEHVPDPVTTLRQAANLLRSGGTCLLRIPVMDTHFWRTFGVDWAELDAPRHLYLMSEKTIRVLAGLTGFRVRKTEFDSQGWELAASLQYQADIPLRDARSFGHGGTSVLFDHDRLAQFEVEAQALNKANNAGRACFYLEKV